MSTIRKARPTLPIRQSGRSHRASTRPFAWEYEDGRSKLLNLYEKGKKLQWNAQERIDWSQDLDPENPEGLPDEIIPIFGTPHLGPSDARKSATKVRRHFQAWQIVAVHAR